MADEVVLFYFESKVYTIFLLMACFGFAARRFIHCIDNLLFVPRYVLPFNILYVFGP